MLTHAGFKRMAVGFRRDQRSEVNQAGTQEVGHVFLLFFKQTESCRNHHLENSVD
uniref:Uncharacterized protein n=1 Tax=Anguilla anguilla TaxID=7936 RepID=A0A0E9XKM9_ANGAN